MADIAHFTEADTAKFKAEQDARRAERLARVARHDAIWMDPFVNACLSHTLEATLRVAREQAIDGGTGAMWWADRELDSPLEWAFLTCWGVFLSAVPGDINYPCPFGLRPQAEAGRFRLDFQIVPMTDGPDAARLALPDFPLIGIELDGHDFHEKTKEQVTRRNQRDRELAAAGWTILRYSGSEFYKDPWGSIRHAYEIAHKAGTECHYRKLWGAHA